MTAMPKDQIGRTVLATALEAHDAGLCVIRAAINGTKKPLGAWKQYQSERPSRPSVEAWFAGGHPGIGIVCGAVSGGLEMLEIEGRAVEAGLVEQLKVEAERRGIRALLNRVAKSYRESTPSGGIHFNYLVDGEVSGNTRLASNANHEPLIETRGEGGFTVIAPSHGPVHPSGRAWTLEAGDWTSLPTLTPSERDQLWDLCRSFDETPQTVTPPPAEHDPFMSSAKQGWIDGIVDEFNRSRSWSDVLVGWSISHEDGGITYWTRPGKEVRAGWSATTNAKGTDRLIVFSSSVAGFKVYDGVGSAPSYDRFGAWVVLNWGGDRVTAARSLRGGARAGYVDPTTGEIIKAWPSLPDEFWDARPILAHIRQAAHSRARSADAVLIFVLARVSLIVDPRIYLPAIVGAKASLNFFGAVVAPSGIGKSSAKEVAADLVPIRLTNVADDLSLGSGEGIIEAFFDLVEEQNGNGKGIRMVKRQTRVAVQLYLDEGQALAEMGSRKGATLLPTLRSAWTGGTLGQANASSETKRRLGAHSYRLAFVAGFQPATAMALLDDADGGTPQRFEWAAATDPTIPDDTPDWPGPIELDPPATSDFGVNEVPVAPAVATEIRCRGLRRTRGEETADPLEGHGDLARLKVATLLAVLDGRLEVNTEDWRLAGIVRTTTGLVRDRVLAHARDRAQFMEMQSVERASRREAHITSDRERRALESMAAAVRNKINRVAGPLARRDLHNATSSWARQSASFDLAIELATERGWIRQDGDGWVRGEA